MTYSAHPANNARGFSLLEMLIATTLLLAGVAPLLALFTHGMATNKMQGEFTSRTVVYAQAKMEELISLNFTDTTSDTTVAPIAPSGGTGLTSGGSIDPDYITNGYSDYLDQYGNRVPAAQAFYTRQWQITDNLTSGFTTSKTIRVYVYSNPVLLQGGPPATSLVCLKANY
jgi:prepilin-type N-terminal cleavage/methylation domain-containing protein